VIYLDYNAATPIAASALSVMQQAMQEAWANPSSVHQAGQRARFFVEQARERVARLIGADLRDVVFTSGGSEACYLGVVGLAHNKQGRVVTTTVEHPAVKNAVLSLQRKGCDVVELPVVSGLAPAVEAFENALAHETLLVAVQWVNHETGTLLPIEDYARVCKQRNIPLFVDATQALGRVPIAVATLGAAAVALASHKIGGPTGAGALFIDRAVPFEALSLLDGQERGRRAGTHSVVPIAGFGAAAATLCTPKASKLDMLRDALERALLERGAVCNGAEGARVDSVTNVSFPDILGKEFVVALDLEGVCISSGSACSSGLDQPSPVISAMYPDQRWRAYNSLRFSLGYTTNAEEVAQTIAAIDRVLPRLRR